MELGVAIVSYNTRDITSNCLASVRRVLDLDQVEGQVWIVDNASEDGSADMIRTDYPNMHLVASRDNLGFARGTNLAIRKMLEDSDRPEYVLLLNPDTIVHPGAFRALLDALHDVAVGVAGANLRYADNSFQHGAFHFPTLPMTLFDFWPLHNRLADSWLNGRYSRKLYEGETPFPVDHPLGACLMTRADVLEEIGLLDEEYFMYCEEIDWCMRARHAGYSALCVPDAEVTHLGGQSSSQFRDKMFVALWKSRFRLFEKHYSRFYRFMARLIVRLGLYRQIAQVREAVLLGEMQTDEAEGRIRAYEQVMGF